jgi:hypothetical protein
MPLTTNAVKLSTAQVLELAEMLTRADLEGKAVRILTGVSDKGSYVMYDTGGGWTPPLYGVKW